MLANVVVRAIHVSCYEDLNAVEREIATILQCEDGKMPACVLAGPFQQFRCDVLWMLSATDGEESDSRCPAEKDEGRLELQQGLFLRFHPTKGKCVVQLVWKEACCAGLQIDPDHELVPLEMKFMGAFSVLSVRDGEH
jgi:hypothetical protein